jgi:hypothetical protein
MSSITTRKTTAAVAITEADAILIDDQGDRIDINPDGSLNVRQTQASINFRAYNATLSAIKDTVYTHINYIVPLGKKFTWLSGNGTSNSWAIWSVKIDSVLWLVKRNAYDEPNVLLFPDAPKILTAGQNIQIEAVNKSITNSNSEIETWLFGLEETI